MPQIHATGTYETFTRAERAVVTARVSVASADRARSIADATALHNWIAGRAQQLRDGGDATWYAADAPSTWARKSYQEGNKSYQEGKGSKAVSYTHLDVYKRQLLRVSAGA